MKKGDIIRFDKSEFKNPCQGTEGEITAVFKNVVRIRFKGINAEKNCTKYTNESLNTYYKKFLQIQIDKGNFTLN